VQALQKGKYQVLSAGENRIRAVLALACAAGAVACLVYSESRTIFYAGFFLMNVAALLLTPLLALALARIVRPLLKAVRPVEGALAADSLLQSPRRTSASVAALMLSLAVVVGFAGMARASYNSIIDWMTTALNPDLFVVPSQNVSIRTFRLPIEMKPELAAVPGVARVQTVREGRVMFRGAPIMLVSVEVGSLGQTARRTPTAGDADEMYRLTAEGKGLIVSDNLAQMRHLSVGDTIDIPAPHGIVHLPVVGIVVDFSDQQGTILMDRTVYVDRWHDDTVNIFRVYLEPGADVPSVKERILERFAGRRLFVLTNDELRAYILRVTDQWLALSSIQIAVAVLVAILGIVNTLTVSITDRRRELGVLRAVGGLQGQIRHTIWIEALSIAIVGVVLGFSLGAVDLYYILQMIAKDIAGMRLAYEYPVRVTMMLVPTMLAAAFVAAIWPAESAVRGSLVEALEYE
jgi:putative ABC transport system permease protein